MRTSTTTGTCAGGGLVAAVIVRESRWAVAQLAQERGWKVTAVYEIGGDAQRRILADAHSGVFQALALGSLSDLGSTPAAALSALLVLDELGIMVASVGESWLAESQPAAAHVARWLATVNRQARAVKIKESMVRSGRKPGRPRRFVPVEEAQRLVAQEGMSVGGTARLLSIPESSLRRALAQRRAEERLAALAALPTQEAA